MRNGSQPPAPIAAGDYILLKVADTGRGIPAGILDRIFDPFFTTKEVGVGTGLGLSLVHGIVTEVGGAIDVETTLGAGSVFTVYLPHAGDVTDGFADEPPAMPRGDQQRVLVVDDEEPLVRLATRDPRRTGLQARRLHVQRRRAGGVPCRSEAVRCRDHRRAYARHVGIGV